MSDAAGNRQAFWRRTLRAWDIGFYALASVSLVACLVDATSAEARWVVVGAFAALVVAYVLLARPSAILGDDRRAAAYLTTLVVATTVVVGATRAGTILLFVAYSQIWFFARTRSRGAAWCVVLTVAVAAATAVRWGASSWWDPLVGFGVGLVFALTLGLWITHVAEQSDERAELLERLEAAQAQLAESHHAAGVLAERERVAQEIHDTLAQGFTSVVMLAQAASAELDRGQPDAVAGRLREMESVARANLAEARALVAAFGPADLQGAELGDALRRLAERFTGGTGIAVRLHGLDALDEAPTLTREATVVVLRVAQEALANVRRHAGAAHVDLEITRDDDGLSVAVTDDGRGLAPDTVEGVGLRGMRDRAGSGGGTLSVGAGPVGGTRVELRLPAGAS